MIADITQFEDTVRACVGFEHGTSLSKGLQDGVFWFLSPHFRVEYDSSTGVFTFTDFVCGSSFSGFVLRNLVPGYLR